MWQLVSTTCLVAHLLTAPTNCTRNVSHHQFTTQTECQAFVDKMTPFMRKDHDHDTETLSCEAVPVAAPATAAKP